MSQRLALLPMCLTGVQELLIIYTYMCRLCISLIQYRYLFFLFQNGVGP